MGTLNLMIVDADQTKAESLVAIIGRNPGLSIVSVVSRRETAIKQLRLKPHVLLVNPGVLKQKTQGRFVKSALEQSPDTKIVFLHEELPDDNTLISDLRMGIRGYIRRNDPPALIAKAIVAVHAGEIWAERRVLEMTITKHMLLPDSFRTHVSTLQPLTCREMDMLNLVIQGATNREIADQANISERTVKTHLYRVYRKLNVKSRTKAIALMAHS